MLQTLSPYGIKKGYISKVIKECEDLYTFHILTQEEAKPGQYNMLYVFGIGEAPITIASKGDDYVLHTVRAVGDVTRHIDRLKEGDVLYYRGPYGNTWDVEKAFNRDVLVLSGGLGLAATRWLFEEIISGKYPVGKVVHVYGSKNADSLLYSYLYEDWKRMSTFEVVVDDAPEGWKGKRGMITHAIEEMNFSKDTVVFMCGPDPMVKACVGLLQKKGIPIENIYASLERHMKCSVGTCGHCMIGPYFVCKDGPVFRYDLIREFFERKEV